MDVLHVVITYIHKNMHINTFTTVPEVSCVCMYVCVCVRMKCVAVLNVENTSETASWTIHTHIHTCSVRCSKSLKYLALLSAECTWVISSWTIHAHMHACMHTWGTAPWTIHTYTHACMHTFSEWCAKSLKCLALLSAECTWGIASWKSNLCTACNALRHESFTATCNCTYMYMCMVSVCMCMYAHVHLYACACKESSLCINWGWHVHL